MSKVEQEIVDALAKAIKLMSEEQKLRLLSFGEGMVFALERKESG